MPSRPGFARRHHVLSRSSPPIPAQGRLFHTARTVRSADVTPAGGLRFDALARYLQQAAEDDLADAAWTEPYTWLVRRTRSRCTASRPIGERVQLRTFCSATGPRWAERTTTVAGPGGHLCSRPRSGWPSTAADGRPVPLGDQFSTGLWSVHRGPRVSARLSLPGRLESADRRGGWPLRTSDFDTAGHVNNSIHWAAVEDVLAGLDWLPAGRT